MLTANNRSSKESRKRVDSGKEAVGKKGSKAARRSENMDTENLGVAELNGNSAGTHDDGEVEVMKVSGGKPKDDQSKSKRGRKEPTAQKWTAVKNTYKKIRTDSANRRTDRRIDESATIRRASTPERTNHSVIGNFAHKTRITFKLNIAASPDPCQFTVNAIQDLFNELNNNDKGCALLPWRFGDFGKGKIDENVIFPGDINKLKTYIPRLYAGKPDERRAIYPNLFIGHNLPFEELRSKMQPWLSNGNNAMYRNMLQVEDTSQIGFFVYSTREMDAGALADEIEDVVGVKVGLRWKTIDIGKRNLPANQQIKALIVEVDSKERYSIQKILVSYYRRTTCPLHEYPNGIRLRFVKPYNEAINTNEKRKIEKLRKRQGEFLKTIRRTSNYDILELDTGGVSDMASGIPTLRQMIMSIQNDGVPLFHSVDLDYMGTGYIFQYSDKVASEAECVINTIIPYLVHFFPEHRDSIHEYFTEEFVERCENLKYDPEAGHVVDSLAGCGGFKIEAEEDLHGFLFGDKAKDDVSSDEESTVQERKENKKKKAKTCGPSDEDSVSTFGGQTISKAVTPPRNKTLKKVFQAGNDSMSVISSSSTVTMETIQSLREETEKKFEAIEEKNTILMYQNSTLQSTLDQLCKALDVNMKPATEDKDGLPASVNSQAGTNGKPSAGDGLQ